MKIDTDTKLIFVIGITGYITTKGIINNTILQNERFFLTIIGAGIIILMITYISQRKEKKEKEK